MQSFSNVYDDDERAKAYATLEFPGTYYLAYRDLPAIVAEYVTGRAALDFGCGAGRSTRFLKKLGFDAMGIDISSSMVHLAANADPDGRYRLVSDGDFSIFDAAGFTWFSRRSPSITSPMCSNVASCYAACAAC